MNNFDGITRMIKWLLLPAACLSASAANAQQLPTVVGQQLGAPVSLPECKRHDYPFIGPDDPPSYFTEQTVTCFELPTQLTDLPFRRGSIDLPQGVAPLFIVGDGLFTYFSGTSDRVIAIEATTLDYTNADFIIRELTTKFGKPTATELDSDVVDGVEIKWKHAIWKRPGYTVNYRAVAYTGTRHGQLLISTDEYDRINAAEASKRTAL